MKIDKLKELAGRKEDPSTFRFTDSNDNEEMLLDYLREIIKTANKNPNEVYGMSIEQYYIPIIEKIFDAIEFPFYHVTECSCTFSFNAAALYESEARR